MQADIIIIHGQCMTMRDNEILHWIAIKNDKIIKVGSENDYQNYLDKKTLVIDAKGKTVLPGFIDSHFHLIQTAMNEKSIDGSLLHSYDEIKKAIKKVERKEPNKNISLVRLSKELLQEQKFPRREILDKISNNLPIYISTLDYQTSILNTYGMLYYKIPFHMDGIELDKNGIPTGIFTGKANAILRKNILDNYSSKRKKEDVLELIPKLLSVGITTLNAMEGGYMYSDKDAEWVYENQTEFPLDIILFYQCLNLERVKNKKLNRVGGSLYIDGTLGARTAALTFEYEDYPGKMGLLNFSQNELNLFLEECYKKHFQTSLYAIGDRAIELALNAHEYAIYKTGIIGLRHRIEHVVMANLEHIKRAKKMGIIFSMNPTYEKYWGGKGNMYEKRLGKKYQDTHKFREIIDGGVTLCAGSDSDVCEYNPFIGIKAAIQHPVKKNRITLLEALKMYTINAAYAIFEEEKKGTLEENKIADIIILNKDIQKENPQDLDQVKVLCTIKSGKIVYNTLNRGKNHVSD